MARLVIVAGASGAGKTFLLKNIDKFYREIKPIQKLTTRPNRKTEPPDKALDLVFSCSDEDVQNCEYRYHYCDHNYGIKRRDIDDALAKGYSPVVIVADCTAIGQIKSEYKDALVIYVQNVLSGEDLKQELEKRGDPIEVEERIRRQESTLNDYVKHIEKKLFDYVIINNFKDEFISQVRYVLGNELLGKVDSNYVFVIMSFDKIYDETYQAYRTAGELLRKSVNVTVERVSENRGGYAITEKIETSIEKAGLVLCDVSEMSPNVFYEFGYARALGKDVIVTAKTGTKLPFDVHNYRTVFYDSAMSLQQEIVAELKDHYHVCEK